LGFPSSTSPTTRASLRSAIEVGLLTQNEARDRLGLAPVDGGDEILRPANTLVGTDPDTDDDEEEDDADA
jgi:hypothetical protein